jgi:hypothetical protein
VVLYTRDEAPADVRAAIKLVVGIRSYAARPQCEPIVIGQRAETTTQYPSRCRVAHVREGRVAPDRPTVQHPEHGWRHSYVERGNGTAHAPAGLQACAELMLGNLRAVPRRHADLGPRAAR